MLEDRIVKRFPLLYLKPEINIEMINLNPEYEDKEYIIIQNNSQPYKDQYKIFIFYINQFFNILYDESKVLIKNIN